MKQALILGCSHAAGSEISSDDQYNYTHSYPVKIAQSLGYRPLNHAIAGGSNDAMFRIFEREMQSLTTNDIVIACWTGCDRSEIYSQENQQWLPMAAGIDNWIRTEDDTVIREGRKKMSGQYYQWIDQCKLYQGYLAQWTMFDTDPAAGRLNKIKNIVALNEIAAWAGIKVINIDSFWPIDDASIIDTYYWPAPVFLDWCLEQKFTPTAQMHFNEGVHQAFANYVVSIHDHPH
jgi:hypothetical protein